MPRKGTGLDFGLVGVPKKFKKPVGTGGHFRAAKYFFFHFFKFYYRKQ